MDDRDKLALEVFYDACAMRNSGRIFLGDINVDDIVEVQRVARIFKENLLIELTNEEIREAAKILKQLYADGEKLAHKNGRTK